MRDTETRPGIDEIWDWLGQVPDPEIPVISLVDLGIIRDVEWQGDNLVVTVTPTYSGCPATSLINFEIEKALRDHGVEKLELKRRLSPAWTTDWISAEGLEKLSEYGIAPPLRNIGDEVPCPRCGSLDTELISQFGSTPCKSNYRCKSCLEPFERFKCH